MAHCINCDVLISDRPSHGDFCSPACAAEYEAGADQEILAANQPVNNLPAISKKVNNSEDSN